MLDETNTLTNQQKIAKKAFENCFEKVNNFNTFKPKENLFKEVVNFQQGDIFNIDKSSSKSGVVVFKNALYHLYDIGKGLDSDKLKNMPKIESLFKKINKSLEQGGLFVMGSLNTDHMNFEKNNISPMQKYQNGKCINIINNTQIHKKLKECGFEPVFYDIYKNADGEICGKNYLPAVWKKVKNVL